MLEFIVLGQVPGTNIQLTFIQVLLVSELYMMVLLALHEINLRRNIVLRLGGTKILSVAIRNLKA